MQHQQSQGHDKKDQALHSREIPHQESDRAMQKDGTEEQARERVPQTPERHRKEPDPSGDVEGGERASPPKRKARHLEDQALDDHVQVRHPQQWSLGVQLGCE